MNIRQMMLSAAMLLVAVHALADIVYLRNGTRQMGLITVNETDLPTITITTSEGELAIQRSRIERIENEPKHVGLTRVGDQFLDKNNYPQAADFYRRALELDKENADIAAKLKQTEQGLASVEATKQDAALAQVDIAVAKSLELSKAEKFQEAIDALRALSIPTDSPKAAEAQKALADVYFLWGTSRMDHQDNPAAVEKLKMAIKLDPTNERAKLNLARVWEGDPTRLNDLIEFYRDSDFPEDQLKVAEAFFRQRKYEEALPIYLKYVMDPKLGSQVIQDRVRIMFDALHRQYAEKGEWEKALQTYRDFLAFSPQEDPLPIARYEYMLQAARTDKNDPAARTQLARYAEERGLVSTARQEYINVITMSPNYEPALQGLRRFATADLEEARALFNEQQYVMAAQRAREAADAYPALPDVVKTANEILTKADIEQQKLQRNKQQQAMQLAQRGDDYYNQALSYISAMVNENYRSNVRVFSPKQEAIKYLARALTAWRSALQLDPSLGAPSSFDLRNKIADANQRYSILTDPRPPVMPFRDLNRMYRGQTSEGSR